MADLLIKICGIRDAKIAAATVDAGADFIGIVFHKHSRRYTDALCAKQIAETVKAAHAEPVAVFVNQTVAEMRAICENTGIHIVQLHGDMSRKQHHLLPDDYQRIYVCTVNDAGGTEEKADRGLAYCLPSRDFVMLDGAIAGSGRTFDWEKFKKSQFFLEQTRIFRWFLAGGLTPDNVAVAITRLQPNGVDISSGVENELGEKDLSRIENFISAAKSVVRG